jgi:hypothetical protein
MALRQIDRRIIFDTDDIKIALILFLKDRDQAAPCMGEAKIKMQDDKIIFEWFTTDEVK